MKRFKNILVVPGETNLAPKDNPVISQALALGKSGGKKVKITLMSVISEPNIKLKSYLDIITPDEMKTITAQQAQNKLEETATLFKENNIDVKTIVAVGYEFIEIIKQVLKESSDLLIKHTDTESDSYSSSDFHVMRKCPCPVWLIKQKHKEKPKKVLVAINPNILEGQDEDTFNKLILSLGEGLATWSKCHLEIVCCWSLYAESTLRYSGFLKIDDKEIDDLLSAEEREANTYLEKLINSVKTDKVKGNVIKGDPKRIIPSFVKENKIDIVVMGTLGRSGIPGFLIGNTAESVLQSINTSVLTIKPSGFKSPIEE